MTQPLIRVSLKQAHRYAFFLVCYELLVYIANDMIMPGMIKVAESFHAQDEWIARSLTFYVLGGASLQLFLGPISDRWGRRPVMLFGALFFCLCSGVIASSQTMQQFIIARFFQGMGLCFISVVGYATIQEMFAEMEAVRLVALMSNVSVLAPLIGPLLGAVFIQHFSWRYIVVVISFLAFVVYSGLLKTMPETVGASLRTGDIIPRLKISPKTIATNYYRLLTNKAYMLGVLSLGLSSAPCLAWVALSPLILITYGKLSLIQYAFWQIPLFGFSILGSWFLQQMTHYYSLFRLIILGSVVVIVGLLLMLGFSVTGGHTYIAIMPGNMIYFFGLGMVMGPLTRFVLFSTDIPKGTASALMSIFTMSIYGLGITLADFYYHGNNIHFAAYCGGVGLIYGVLISTLGWCFYAEKISAKLDSNNR